MNRGIVVLSLVSMLQGRCDRHAPPVLFHSDAGAPTVTETDAPTASVDAGPPSDAGPRPVLLSNAVPGDGSSLTVDGVTVRAPDGERFVRYLALDPDHDGDRDIAVLQSRAAPAPAHVAFYRREPAQFVSVPINGGDDPTDVRCTDAQIRSTSPENVLVDYACPPPAPSPTPGTHADTAIGSETLVIGLAATPSVRLRIADLLPSFAGVVAHHEVSTADRDHDGRDDVVVTIAARGPLERDDVSARASVVLLDRQTGFARDTSEPEASFAALATQARSLATRRRAGDAVAAVERIQRLHRVLCTEAGAPRIRIGTEVGVSCRGSQALQSAAESQARAYLALGELPAAEAATQTEGAGELGPVSSPRFLADLRRAESSGTEHGLIVRPGPNVGTGLAASTAARASGLAFDPPSSPAAVVVNGPAPARVDLATLTATPFVGGNTNDTRPHAPDGSYLVQGAYETCSGVVVALCPSAASECGGAPARPDEIPAQAVLAHLPVLGEVEHAAQCVREGLGSSFIARAIHARILGYGRDGVLVAYRSVLYRVRAGEPNGTVVWGGLPLGGPFGSNASVSPSGAYTVLPGSSGLFVRDPPGHWHLWSDTQLAARYVQMTDLTVSDDGRTIAGLMGTQLWVVSHEIPHPAPAADTGTPDANAPAPIPSTTPTPATQ